MHYHFIEDADGDLVDAVPFCSDACHRDWCRAQGERYGGWNGAHGGADYPEPCAECGELCSEAA